MFNRTKRIGAAALAAVLVCSLLAGCNSTGAEKETTSAQSGTSSLISGQQAVDDPLYGEGANGTISLKVWGPEAAQSLLKVQCDRFAEEYSEYGDIQIEVVPQGEADAGALVLTDASTAADVFGFTCDNLDKLVTAGVLMPVTGYDAEVIKNDNHEGAVEAATIDGTLYAYPETGDNSYCLVYDKSVVSDEQAKTLEGVLKACKDANKKFVMAAEDGFYASMFMFTGGLTIDGFEEDGVTQKFSDYDEKKVVNTMKAFSELFAEYKDNFFNGDVTKVVDGFKSGTAGAGIDGSWNFTQAKEVLGENAGFATLPTINVDGEPTQIINLFGYKLIGVNATTKYPNTSIELAKYLTSEQCQLERAEQLNWGPSNINASESEAVQNDEALTAILAQAEYSVPQVSISPTYWTPVATLGGNIVNFEVKMTDAEYKDLLEKTIANIRDE